MQHIWFSRRSHWYVEIQAGEHRVIDALLKVRPLWVRLGIGIVSVTIGIMEAPGFMVSLKLVIRAIGTPFGAP